MRRGEKRGHCGCSIFVILPVILIICLVAAMGSCLGGDDASGTSSAVSVASSASSVSMGETASDTSDLSTSDSSSVTASDSSSVSVADASSVSAADASSASAEEEAADETTSSAADSDDGTEDTFQLSEVPAYAGEPYTEVHQNIPYFSESDLTTESYESYGALDDLGRCTAAIACIGQDLMPTEERGEIGDIRPTGWHTVKYDGIDGNYLYNRCHLIGYQLTGENANAQNLITGTRYMNVEGMEPFENMTADYIRETGNHVLYRVTPEFEGSNLLASGVLMEAESVEDQGAGVLFCVYCYNVQPGVTIDYATGDSSGPAFTGSEEEAETTEAAATPALEDTQAEDTAGGQTYILNTNTMKFHYPSCRSVSTIKDANKEEYTGSRDDLIAQGYEPCKICNP